MQTVRRILNLAAGEWLDEYGLTWLAHAPKIKLLPEHDKRKPYPLSWEEESRLLAELPLHLVKMAGFAANTGCRSREVCNLQWQYETQLDNKTIVFVIPGCVVKNREDRLVVLNAEAQLIVESVRGKHPDYVFTYGGKPVKHILNTAWKKARIRAGLPHLRVHDLKHTFGRRLRAAGVNFEDRQDLLGHKSGRITTHYSAAEVHNLIDAANRALTQKDNSVTITMLKTRSATNDKVNLDQRSTA